MEERGGNEAASRGGVEVAQQADRGGEEVTSGHQRGRSFFRASIVTESGK